jgi:hypothetical protein
MRPIAKNANVKSTFKEVDGVTLTFPYETIHEIEIGETVIEFAENEAVADPADPSRIINEKLVAAGAEELTPEEYDVFCSTTWVTHEVVTGPYDGE